VEININAVWSPRRRRDRASRRRRRVDGVASAASRRRHRVDGVAAMASRASRERVDAPRLYGACSTQDGNFFDDLDAEKLDPYKPFLKLEGDRLAAWRREHPSHGGAIPSSVFSGSSTFKLVKDVASQKQGLRSGGAADLKPPGEFKLKDLSSMKKEAFNYEKLLLPNGPPIDDDYKAYAPENSVAISAYSLPALKAVHVHFSGEVQRYTDAVSARTAKGFQFDWRGNNVEGPRSLQRALRCKAFQGSTAKRVAEYVAVLDAKIKEFEAAAAAA